MSTDLKAELTAINEEQQANLAESLKEINELAVEAYEAKLAASKAEDHAKQLKSRLSNLMESAGVDKIVTDVCTVSGKISSKVSVPKAADKKQALFNYIKEKYGEEVLGDMLTINARSFTSFYDKEVELEANKGNVDFKLDMVEPYEVYTVGFRKKAGK